MVKIKCYKVSIAGGLTILTTSNLTEQEKSMIVKDNPDVEQFGTFRVNGSKAYVQFWGGEFSGAGVMAVFGIDSDIRYVECLDLQVKLKKNSKDLLQAEFPGDIIRSIQPCSNGILVNEKGISFFVSTKRLDTKSTEIESNPLVKAEGTVYLDKNKIYPYVYVRKLNTFNLEKACVTACLAVKSVFPNINNFEQQSGENIKVTKDGDSYLIQANVKLVDVLNY